MNSLVLISLCITLTVAIPYGPDFYGYTSKTVYNGYEPPQTYVQEYFVPSHYQPTNQQSFVPPMSRPTNVETIPSTPVVNHRVRRQIMGGGQAQAQAQSQSQFGMGMGYPFMGGLGGLGFGLGGLGFLG